MKIEYDELKNVLNIEDNKGNIISYYSVLSLNRVPNVENYKCYLLYRSNTPENFIHDVFDRGINSRIGWMFPCQALFSNAHEYTDNPHFLRYAYVGIVHLIIENFNRLIDCDDVNSYLINEYTDGDEGDSSKNLFIVSDDIMSMNSNFNYNKYMLSLFAYGYTEKRDVILTPLKEIENIHINLRELPKDVVDNAFVNEVFNSLWRENLPAVVKFHLLYQIVEIFISKVFDEEFKNTMKELNDRKEGLFSFKNKISQIVNEEYRVGKLLNEYSNIGRDNKANLCEACRNFLKKCNKSQSDKTDAITRVGADIYKVRNIIFHEYHTIPREQRNEIEMIDDCFLKSIIDMLMTYKSPFEIG